MLVPYSDLKRTRKDFLRVRPKLRKSQENGSTDKFWKHWSRAVEKGWLEYVDESEEVRIQAGGRGKVETITIKPKTTMSEKMGNQKSRGEDEKKATHYLKQARRAEQIVHRIALANDREATEAEKKKYIQHIEVHTTHYIT